MKKHLNSILICEMSDGTLNLYSNGIPVIIDNKRQCNPRKLVNSISFDKISSNLLTVSLMAADEASIEKEELIA